MLKKNLVVSIYSPPEFYPPTLNAIEYLSGEFNKIFVLFRNYDGPFNWIYPENVYLIPEGRKINVRSAEKLSAFKKIISFLRYSLKLFSLIRKTRSEAILLYDYMPILAFRLINRFIKTPKLLWYHNHDVGDDTFLARWSLSWLAWKSEKWIFPRLDIFSLPSLERKVFFPMNKFRGKFFFLPNFPSLKVFSRYAHIEKDLSGPIRIVYQGSIGPLHGIEEIISLLGCKINGKHVKLILKGFLSDEYRIELSDLAKKNGVAEDLIFLPPTGYDGVIENSMACHIGIGIHRKEDIMNKTLGTSSNKIYEYAASGLPVLLFDNPHFRSHLGHFTWTFFTDCSRESLSTAINDIDRHFGQLSDQARSDFKKQLNFENYFKPLCQFLNS